MRMTHGVVAHAAEKTDGDRIHLRHILTYVATDKLPLTIPQLCVTVWLQIGPQDQAKTYRLAVNLHDPDGRQLLTTAIDYAPPTVGSELNFHPVLPACFLFLGVDFVTFGGHRFEVFCDGELLGEVPFEVLRAS